MSDYEKLKALSDQAEVLIERGGTAANTEFKVWKTRAERFLRQRFGEGSRELKDFLNTSFFLYSEGSDWVKDDNGEAGFQINVDYCRQGLEYTKAIFDIYLEEMAEEAETQAQDNHTTEDLREGSRLGIETLEMWARRLIHEKMSACYGEDYIDATLSDGSYLVKNEIRDHVHRLMNGEPDKFSRPVDTMNYEHVVYLLCKKELYRSHFKEALKYAYPQGCDEAREFLNRLIPIRNSLSHANPISTHDAERAVCYSHDFVEGIKQYYKVKGEERKWNVPSIIKVADSLGNVFSDLGDDDVAYITIPQELRCGDAYSVSIEVDSSFSGFEYAIKWTTNGKEYIPTGSKLQCSIMLSEQDVGENSHIDCWIVSNKSWHKYGIWDSRVIISMKVLPPIE